jgi:hypothetical protein
MNCAELTENHALEAWNKHDIKSDALGEGNETSCVQSNPLSPQFSLDDGSAGMHEGHSIAIQTLQNKTLA